MNPMVIAAATEATGKAIESGKVKELLIETRRPALNFAIVLLVVAVLVVGFFMFKKWKKEADKAKFNDVDDPAGTKDPKVSLAKTYANRINAALSWYNDDEEEIYEVGRQMRNNGVSFSLVAKAFKAGFQKDLAATLSNSLNATELKKFYQSAGLAGLGTVRLYGANKELILTY